MRLAIIGLPGAGKRTLFHALTGARGEAKAGRGSASGAMVGTVRVEDERVDFLQKVFQPKKTTYAQVEYLLPARAPTESKKDKESQVWNQVKTCDALIHVLRNFVDPGGLPPTPEEDFYELEGEMILSDLLVAEKRLERIDLDRKRGKQENEREYVLLQECRSILEANRPIRDDPELAKAPELKGFTFLSAKPELVVINNDDEDTSSPQWTTPPGGPESMIIRGRLEMELSAMPPEEAAEFRSAYSLQKTALDRVIRSSYKILRLISFFTVLNQEVRAWTIPEGTTALDAAGTVHSDMRKGFIRAEVLPFPALKEYGSFQEARKSGQVRLEGKGYRVQDGDIINFRFNV